MADELELEIRQIEPGDKLTGLSLGDEAFRALKTFLSRDARSYHNRNLARTYAAFVDGVASRKDPTPPKKLIAYVTLVCGEVTVDSEDGRLIEDEGVEYRYKHYPALKIARLAVDRRYWGNDIGSALVSLALGIAKDIICPAVGCRFAVVDSKQKSIAFYSKQGFTFLDTNENRARSEPIMFIDLWKSSQPPAEAAPAASETPDLSQRVAAAE